MEYEGMTLAAAIHPPKPLLFRDSMTRQENLIYDLDEEMLENKA